MTRGRLLRMNSQQINASYLDDMFVDGIAVVGRKGYSRSGWG